MKFQSLLHSSLMVGFFTATSTVQAFQPTPSALAPRTAAAAALRPLNMAPEIVEPSYNLALGAFGLGLLGGVLEDVKDSNTGEKLPTATFFGGSALLFTLFSVFLAFQTTTLRFSFDDTAFALVKAGSEETFENVVVGGTNSWKYESFVNWNFLPSSQFPILVYFRETQTPADVREEIPLEVDNLEGQVHFFPAIANSKQLEAGFIKHNCAKAAE